jgi:DNA-binding response OmpR family regulator
MLCSNCKDIKVLFVDDEKSIAKSIKSALGDYFEKFIVVSNGIEALKIFKKEHPDLLITDIMIPKMNGLELARAIKQSSPNFPIIIQSAYSDKDKLLDAISIGVKKYFIKPVDIDTLLSYIESLVSTIKASWVIELIGGFKFNTKYKTLYLNQKIIYLTNRENQFIELLLSQKDILVDRVTMKKSLWKDCKKVSDERVRTFVKRLREKTSKRLIVNSRDEGYMIKFY